MVDKLSYSTCWAPLVHDYCRRLTTFRIKTVELEAVGLFQMDKFLQREVWYGQTLLGNRTCNLLRRNPTLYGERHHTEQQRLFFVFLRK